MRSNFLLRLKTDRRTIATQHIFLDLSGRRLRQFRHERELAWRLEMCQPASHEFSQLRFGDAGPGLQHDERMRDVAPLRVWHADHSSLEDRRVPEQHTLDFD